MSDFQQDGFAFLEGLAERLKAWFVSVYVGNKEVNSYNVKYVPMIERRFSDREA